MNKKIALIIPFYGQWPIYLGLYFKGCEYNSWLDVFIFTDTQPPADLPSNVKIISYPLKKLNDKIGLLIDRSNYKLPFAYKLCDVRPLYGKIFQEYLISYDYWGFGDLDLIYGDLKKIISTPILNDIDVISMRRERICGSFTIFKNNAQINSLYNQIVNLDTLLCSDKFEGIDETCNDWVIKEKYLYSPSCLTYVVNKNTEEGNLKSYFQTHIQEGLYSNIQLHFEGGKLSDELNEYAYFHYITNKVLPEFKFPKWDNVPNSFYINRSGFYKKNRLGLITYFSLKNKLLYYLAKVLKRLKKG